MLWTVLLWYDMNVLFSPKTRKTAAIKLYTSNVSCHLLAP